MWLTSAVCLRLSVNSFDGVYTSQFDPVYCHLVTSSSSSTNGCAVSTILMLLIYEPKTSAIRAYNFFLYKLVKSFILKINSSHFN